MDSAFLGGVHELGTFPISLPPLVDVGISDAEIRRVSIREPGAA